MTILILDLLLRILIFVTAAINVVYYFFPIPVLVYISAVMMSYIIICSIITLPRAGRRVIVGLIFISAILMIYSGADLYQWIIGIGRNGMLIALFVCSPLLHLPFQYDNYEAELGNLARRHMRTMIPFNLLIAFPTHILAALTGFAALGIMYNLFRDISKYYDAEDIFHASLLRSYATSGFWGTSWVSVALVVSVLGIQWHRLILLGMVFIAVSIAINLLDIMIRMFRRPGRYPSLPQDDTVLVNWRKLSIMLMIIVLIVLIILVINLRTGWSLLAIVPLVSLTFPVLAAIPQRRWRQYKSGVGGFAKIILPKQRLIVSLFTAAGLLAHALELSGAGQLIPGLIPSVLMGQPFLLIMLIALLIIVPGQIGVHPVVSGTTLVATIVPAMLGLTVPQFALAIIFGWMLSTLLSPFSGMTMTLAGLCGQSSFRLGIRLNWHYGLICLIVYAAMAVPLSAFLQN